MNIQSITQSELKELFSYNPDTGHLEWIKSAGNHIHAGLNAGHLTKNGYIRVSIKSKRYMAHRLIFLYMTDEIPDQVDHINHIRNDNRWSNLRPATNVINQRNATLSSNNTSGFCGVHWHMNCRKWISQIRVNGAIKHLGYFFDKQDAIRARQHANIKYGYHENHGKL